MCVRRGRARSAGKSVRACGLRSTHGRQTHREQTDAQEGHGHPDSAAKKPRTDTKHNKLHKNKIYLNQKHKHTTSRALTALLGTHATSHKPTHSRKPTPDPRASTTHDDVTTPPPPPTHQHTHTPTHAPFSSLDTHRTSIAKARANQKDDYAHTKQRNAPPLPCCACVLRWCAVCACAAGGRAAQERA